MILIQARGSRNSILKTVPAKEIMAALGKSKAEANVADEFHPINQPMFRKNLFSLNKSNISTVQLLIQ